MGDILTPAIHHARPPEQRRDSKKSELYKNREGFVPSRQLLYRPDVCNHTVPPADRGTQHGFRLAAFNSLSRQNRENAVWDPAYTGVVFALHIIQFDVIYSRAQG